jgi:WD40 repeat protein
LTTDSPKARVGPETSRAEPEQAARRRRAYDAFISYSRTADGRLGPALQRGLQRFAKPWYRLRALRVFRDDASLSANPDLWGSIQQALDDSDYFILLASPAAAQSPWVAKEAEYWLEHRGTERLLVVLTEGDLFWDAGSGVDRTRTSALPGPLDDAFAEEPRYVDLRWARSDAQLAQRDARFRNALADLAAPIHGRSKDEMLGEDVRQHKRTLAVAWSAAALLATLAIGASVLAVLAVQARDRARTQANIAVSRQLAAESAAQLEGPSAVSPLLALESYRRVRTQPAERSYDARNAMLVALERSPRLLATLPASQLRDASFSPDGKRLATGGGDGSLRFWDARDGRPLGPPLAGSGSAVRAMAFSPDGNTVAVGDDSGRVTFWDAKTEKPRGSVLRATRWITLIMFSPDGGNVAVIGSDETFGPDRVRVWDARNPRRSPSLLGEDDGIVDVAFTADGSALFSTNDVGDVKLWTGRGPRARPHGGKGYQLATGPDGRVLLLAQAAGGARIVDALSGEPLGPKLPVSGAFFFDVATAGRAFASGESGQALALWNLRRTKLVAETLVAGQGAFATPVFSPGGAELATVGADGTVKLWDSGDENPFARETRPVPRGSAFAEAASAVALGSHGRAAAGDSTSVTFWDDPSSTGARRAATWGASSLAFSPDGTVLATGGTNGGITFWDTVSHRPLAAPRSPHRASVWSLAFSADGNELSSRSADGVVEVWDMSHRKPTPGGRSKIALPPQCPGGDPSGKYESCPDAPTSVAFAPDGTLVYGTSGDGVRLWDPVTRRSLGELGTAATDVALAPDGVALATVSDNAVRLWDVSRRQSLGGPLPDSGGTAAVAFGNDGTGLASGGANGTVTIWDPLLLSNDFEAWRGRLCRLAGRNLTEAEWARFLPGERYRTTCPGLP